MADDESVQAQPNTPLLDSVSSEPISRCTYVLDHDDVVTQVDHSWAQFANVNGVPELVHAVIGRSVFDFFSGDETKAFFCRLHLIVRAQGSTCQLPFRCDGNGYRRDMVLLLEPLKNGALRQQGLLMAEIAVKPRAPHPETCRKCPLCLQVRVSNECWDNSHFETALHSNHVDYRVCAGCWRLIDEISRPL